MSKTILITGSTDGIGLEAAKAFVEQGHRVLIHGRSPDKLSDVVSALRELGQVEGYLADLTDLDAVEKLAKSIAETYNHLDVLINNAGVFQAANSVTAEGYDIRFFVNAIAPYHLTQKLLPLMGQDGRVVNLSSAAQAPVNMDAFSGKTSLSAGSAYAQSKLALTMWSNDLARSLPDGPVIIAVNPGSLLGTKMVKEAYEMDGKDIHIGSDILVRLALDTEFAGASGKYFDNDIGRFGPPHPDALNSQKSQQVVEIINSTIAKLLN